MTRLTYATRKEARSRSPRLAPSWPSSASSFPASSSRSSTSSLRATGCRTEPLEIGGKGLFVKEIEEALLEKRAELAVHSLKDVPPELAPGLVIGCFPRRADPRDALVSRPGRSSPKLPTGSRVGTSSLRRKVQLKGARPDLLISDLRGNVDTRLRKCKEGEFDAIVLASAGLTRLEAAGRSDRDPGSRADVAGGWPGRARQLELRADDEATARILVPASHLETKIAVTAERGVMTAVSGNCQTPVGAYAIRDRDELWLRGMLAEPDGSRVRIRELRIGWPSSEAEAERAGLELGAMLTKS